MSKYDWSNVPSDVNFIATDGDGWAWGWVDNPHPIGTNEWLTVAGNGLFCEFFIKPESNTFNGNWQDSLEERPK